jgi:hypothetical protein
MAFLALAFCVGDLFRRAGSNLGDLESAMLRLNPPSKKPKSGLASELEAAVDAITHVPWTALEEWKVTRKS